MVSRALTPWLPVRCLAAFPHFENIHPYNTQKIPLPQGKRDFYHIFSIHEIKFEVVHGDSIAILDAELAHFVYDAVFTHHALEIRE